MIEGFDHTEGRGDRETILKSYDTRKSGMTNQSCLSTLQEHSQELSKDQEVATVNEMATTVHLLDPKKRVDGSVVGVGTDGTRGRCTAVLVSDPSLHPTPNNTQARSGRESIIIAPHVNEPSSMPPS